MPDRLERAREHRASLRAAMGEVELALAAPSPRREGQWRDELGVKLAALDQALDWHIAATEGEDGLLAEIAAAAPRFADRVERARRDHERLRAGIEQASDAMKAGAAVDELRDQVVVLLSELVRHRQRGSDLVFDAYNIHIDATD